MNLKQEGSVGRHHVPLARIFGISIGLDYSWFLIFVLFTWALARSYYPGAYCHAIVQRNVRQTFRRLLLKRGFVVSRIGDKAAPSRWS
jgi:hypothetical protein